MRTGGVHAVVGLVAAVATNVGVAVYLQRESLDTKWIQPASVLGTLPLLAAAATLLLLALVFVCSSSARSRRSSPTSTAAAAVVEATPLPAERPQQRAPVVVEAAVAVSSPAKREGARRRHKAAVHKGKAAAVTPRTHRQTLVSALTHLTDDEDADVSSSDGQWAPRKQSFDVVKCSPRVEAEEAEEEEQEEVAAALEYTEEELGGVADAMYGSVAEVEEELMCALETYRRTRRLRPTDLFRTIDKARCGHVAASDLTAFVRVVRPDFPPGMMARYVAHLGCVHHGSDGDSLSVAVGTSCSRSLHKLPTAFVLTVSRSYNRERKVDFQDLGNALKRVKALSQTTSLSPPAFRPQPTASLHALVVALGDDGGLEATLADWARRCPGGVLVSGDVLGTLRDALGHRMSDATVQRMAVRAPSARIRCADINRSMTGCVPSSYTRRGRKAPWTVLKHAEVPRVGGRGEDDATDG